MFNIFFREITDVRAHTGCRDFGAFANDGLYRLGGGSLRTCCANKCELQPACAFSHGSHLESIESEIGVHRVGPIEGKWANIWSAFARARAYNYTCTGRIAHAFVKDNGKTELTAHSTALRTDIDQLPARDPITNHSPSPSAPALCSAAGTFGINRFPIRAHCAGHESSCVLFAHSGPLRVRCDGRMLLNNKYTVSFRANATKLNHLAVALCEHMHMRRARVLERAYCTCAGDRAARTHVLGHAARQSEVISGISFMQICCQSI